VFFKPTAERRGFDFQTIFRKFDERAGKCPPKRRTCTAGVAQRLEKRLQFAEFDRAFMAQLVHRPPNEPKPDFLRERE
jgi:hypothetical protein